MNAVKTALLLGVLTGVLLFGGAMLAGEQGVTIALFIAVLMNGIAYFYSDKIALRMSGAQPVTREQAPRLYSLTEQLCARAGIPMPRLYIIPQAAPNAFATGRSPRHGHVAVTAGLLELMTEEEVQGVIAHELAHIKNYDILTASVAATLAAAITWLAYMGRWAMILGGRGGGRDGGNALGMLLMLILAPIAAVLIQLAISRQREYAADAAAAKMAGHPFGLVKALEKLGAYNKRIPMDVQPATSSLFIVAPLGAGRAFMNLFSTHPPLEKRIAALQKMVIAR